MCVCVYIYIASVCVYIYIYMRVCMSVYASQHALKTISDVEPKGISF